MWIFSEMDLATAGARKRHTCCVLDIVVVLSNGLTGRLPPELGNLRYLQELRLDRNRLQGSVPAGSSSIFDSNMHEILLEDKGVMEKEQNPVYGSTSLVASEEVTTKLNGSVCELV
ncbi:hypothetical protein RIF29_39553 [Crotalaria pallida]|uniref:Uncharacterized protein n=1 Tax=Crotalaria pallida TaxID=3830 RepID=A0AAN9HQT9_CROPI